MGAREPVLKMLRHSANLFLITCQTVMKTRKVTIMKDFLFYDRHFMTNINICANIC